MINNLFNNLDDIISTRKHKTNELQRWEKKKETQYKLLENLEKARNIFQSAAKITQTQLSDKLSGTVTSALDAVFPDPYKFRVDFIERRNVTECDLLFEKNENTKDPLKSCGFGAADIAALALRVAFWKLTTNRNTLVLDEPTRNLDIDKQPLASLMIQALSKSANLQFIITTHQKALMENADKVFIVKQINGISSISTKKEKQINESTKSSRKIIKRGRNKI